MFCIYENKFKSGWTSEYVVEGKWKAQAFGATPIESITKLFEMIGDDDETGTYAEIDGTKSLLPSGDSQPPNCS
jgi:hypothetical protein